MSKRGGLKMGLSQLPKGCEECTNFKECANKRMMLCATAELTIPKYLDKPMLGVDMASGPDITVMINAADINVGMMVGKAIADDMDKKLREALMKTKLYGGACK